MNRCLNNDDAGTHAATIVELGEADLALVQGGSFVVPWLPPSFPIRNPLPSPALEPFVAPTRPNAGPRPNPMLEDALLDVRAALQKVTFGL